MLYTPSEANKLLKSLQDREQMLLEEEQKNRYFVVAHVENPEDVRPAYNFDEMEHSLDKVRMDIIRVKHAINQFNVRTEVPDTGFTVDEILVLIPKLTERQRTLRAMASKQPKERMASYSSGLVEYSYANYDVPEVRKNYDLCSVQLDKCRTCLDTLNSTAREIEIDFA